MAKNNKTLVRVIQKYINVPLTCTFKITSLRKYYKQSGSVAPHNIIKFAVISNDFVYKKIIV